MKDHITESAGERREGRGALTMSALSALPALRDRNWAPKENDKA